MIRKRSFLKWITCPADDPTHPQDHRICHPCKYLVEVMDDGILCRYEDEDDDDLGGEE